MLQQLIVMRHATAEAKAVNGRDRDRDLTADGIEEARLMGVVLHRILADIPVIVSSEYVRAQRTAAAVSSAFAAVEASVDGRLNADRTVADMMDFVDETEASSLILVAHMPVVAELVERYTGVPAPSLMMAPATCVLLSLESKRRRLAVLQGMLSADLARQII